MIGGWCRILENPSKPLRQVSIPPGSRLQPAPCSLSANWFLLGDPRCSFCPGAILHHTARLGLGHSSLRWPLVARVPRVCPCEQYPCGGSLASFRTAVLTCRAPARVRPLCWGGGWAAAGAKPGAPASPQMLVTCARHLQALATRVLALQF